MAARIPDRRNFAAMVVIGLFGLGMAGVGAGLLVIQHLGPKATALVTACVSGGRAGDTCTGTWTRHGRAVSGTIDGADFGDLHERLTVHLFGSRAYHDGIGVLLGLLVIGGICLAAALQIYRGKAGPDRSSGPA